MRRGKSCCDVNLVLGVSSVRWLLVLLQLVAHYHNRMDGLLCKLTEPCVRRNYQPKNRSKSPRYNKKTYQWTQTTAVVSTLGRKKHVVWSLSCLGVESPRGLALWMLVLLSIFSLLRAEIQQLLDLRIMVMVHCASPGRGGELVVGCDVCVTCAEGGVKQQVNSLSGIL